MAVFDPNVICRLCAKEKEFCVDVFGEDGVKNNLSKKIRLCLPVTVSIIQSRNVSMEFQLLRYARLRLCYSY